MGTPLSLLEIVQTACNELGLNAPASVVGSTDLQVIQLLALVNRDGNELYRSNDWTALSGEHIVNLQEPITATRRSSWFYHGQQHDYGGDNGRGLLGLGSWSASGAAGSNRHQRHHARTGDGVDHHGHGNAADIRARHLHYPV